MSAVQRWFDRKFDFDFPVEKFGEVCSRLRGAPGRLELLARGAPREVLVRKVGEEWSAQEHAGHLGDMEPLWMARVEDFLRGGATLTVADLTNRKTFEAGHNGRDLEEILGEFRRARGLLTDRVEGLEAEAFSRSMIHPRLGTPMRLVDHLYFVAEHDDHHIARIAEMIG